MGPKRVLSAEEIEARKKRRAEQQRRRYAAKCGLERERMLARKREVERRRMECASDRERLLARKREAERHRVYGSDRERLLARKREAERRRMECASERERVLARKREAERRRMECASERERVLAQKREAERRRMECPTERERVLAQKREAERRRVAAMSPEERNEHLAHKREVQMRRSDAARQQRIWAAFASASLVAAQVTVAITIVFQPDILVSGAATATYGRGYRCTAAHTELRPLNLQKPCRQRPQSASVVEWMLQLGQRSLTGVCASPPRHCLLLRGCTDGQIPQTLMSMTMALMCKEFQWQLSSTSQSRSGCSTTRPSVFGQGMPRDHT
ncbi:uncharacterized protein [Dermacentor andersoni]|uniref:uncharacterized protein isoform X2 n=1 Tax=Dermacentor andersoni TaxID=34620 RepID=UPI002415C3DC|nr:uncharacterized protein LOC126544456 isoform X2 [Dermacentor andersoni]